MKLKLLMERETAWICWSWLPPRLFSSRLSSHFSSSSRPWAPVGGAELSPCICSVGLKSLESGECVGLDFPSSCRPCEWLLFDLVEFQHRAVDSCRSLEFVYLRACGPVFQTGFFSFSSAKIRGGKCKVTAVKLGHIYILLLYSTVNLCNLCNRN